MATTLAAVVNALTAAVEAVTYVDPVTGNPRAWARTEGNEGEGELSAADRDGKFLLDFPEPFKRTRDTGLDGIVVIEQRAALMLYRATWGGDVQAAQVRLLDDARAVERAVEDLASPGLEFSTVETTELDTTLDELTVKLTIVLRFQATR